MAYDQDAVDEAVRILQPQIDDLKAQIVGLTTQIPIGYMVTYPGEITAVYQLVPTV